MIARRLFWFLGGVIAGELIGTVMRGFFPPVPGWPFRISLFISLAGIAGFVIWLAKPGDRAGDLLFAAFAGTYLGYAF